MNLDNKMGHFINIQRYCQDGVWELLEISMTFCDENVWTIYANINDMIKVEPEAVKDIIVEFVEKFPTLECYITRIEEWFSYLRENNINEKLYSIQELSVEQVALLTHVSCGASAVVVSQPVTRRCARSYGIPQDHIKYLLKSLDEESKVLKFFKENECPICFNSYLDILQSNLHILVFEFCHHALCCNCLDNIIKTKPECPCCRNEYTYTSFMQFDIDLKQFGNAFCKHFEV